MGQTITFMDQFSPSILFWGRVFLEGLCTPLSCLLESGDSPFSASHHMLGVLALQMHAAASDFLQGLEDSNSGGLDFMPNTFAHWAISCKLNVLKRIAVIWYSTMRYGIHSMSEFLKILQITLSETLVRVLFSNSFQAVGHNPFGS